MRIKLLESQVHRLKLITENSDMLSELRTFAEKAAHSLDQIYSKLSFVTLNEIFNNEIPLEDIGHSVSAIEHSFSKKCSLVYQWIDSHDPDDQVYIDMYDQASSIERTVTNKINALDFVLFPLKEVAEKALEHEIIKNFPNKQIDI
jgi:uncharacterized coiled-coil protein SlyX